MHLYRTYARMERHRLLLWVASLLIAAALGALALGVIRSHDSDTAELRVSARKLSDGRVELSLQQRDGVTWNDRLLPTQRFLPRNTVAARWLNSSIVTIDVIDPAAAQSSMLGADSLFTAAQHAALGHRGYCAQEFWETAAIADVQQAIRGGAEVDCRDQDSNFGPIHWAVRANSVAVVRALLDAGVRIDAAGGSAGASAIHYAAYNPNPQILAALIQLGADAEAKDNGGLRPFHYIGAYGGPGHVAVLSDLFANIAAKSNTGWEPIHSAAAFNNSTNINSLIAAGASIEAITDENSTPLDLAVQFDHLEAVEALIAAGAPVAHGTSGQHILRTAARHVEDVDIVRVLINAGAKTYRSDTGSNSWIGSGTACAIVTWRDSNKRNSSAIKDLLCNEGLRSTGS